MTKTESYRNQIYRHYATVFKGAQPEFDAARAQGDIKFLNRRLKGWLPAGKDAAIADIGCGDGRLLFFFRSAGFSRLTGVDVSSDQVGLARQVVPDIVEGDATHFLESHSGVFDLVTALDLIEHLHKDEVLRFLEACHGALQPAGRLILQTPNAASPWFGSVRYGDFTHETCFTPDGLAHLLSLCGFKEVETREAGPIVHGTISAIRWVAWQGIRLSMQAWNLVEGATTAPVLTRVFLASAVKR